MALTPAERVKHPPSAYAWSVVTGETPIADSAGKTRPATVLIFSWFREYLQSVCKRSLTWRGEPLHSSFAWVSSGYFNGRMMTDVADELLGAALEHAASAVDSHRSSRGPLIAWMRQVMFTRLNNDFEAWVKTSSSVNDEREESRALDTEHGGSAAGRGSTYFGDTEGGTASGTEFVRRTRLANDNRMKLMAEIEPEVPPDPALNAALKELSAMEREALTRFAEGEWYGSIARNLGLAGATSAHRIVDRARLKMRDAIAWGPAS